LPASLFFRAARLMLAGATQTTSFLQNNNAYIAPE
jgi:hypothetical protein